MLIVALWLTLALAARILERSWWSPPAMFALVGAVDAIGTITLAPEYFMSLTANLEIQLFGVLVLLGSRLGFAAPLMEKPGYLSVTIFRPRLFLTAGFVCGLMALVATTQAVGVPLSKLASPTAVATVAQAATKQRYTQGLEFPVYYSIANACLLAYAMIAAMDFAKQRRVAWPLCIPLLMYIISNLLITTRAPILFMLLLMLLAAGFSQTDNRGNFPALFSGRFLVVIFGMAVSVAAIYFYFQVVRFGAHYSQTNGQVVQHLRRYPWGSLPGYSLWVEGRAGQTPSHHVGYYTFMGLLDNLGIEARTPGSYSDYVSLAPGEKGNIYTALRGLRLDFGWVGTIAIALLVGFAGGAASSRRVFAPATSLAIYVAIASFAAFFLVVSFWSFTANLLAILILPMALRIFANPKVPADLPAEDGVRA